MAKWKVHDKQFSVLGITKPGVCKCKQQALSYEVSGGPPKLIQPDAIYVGFFRRMLGRAFPATLPRTLEPTLVPQKEYRHRQFVTGCAWCKYLKAMGVTRVHIDYEPCTMVYTLTRTDGRPPESWVPRKERTTGEDKVSERPQKTDIERYPCPKCGTTRVENFCHACYQD